MRRVLVLSLAFAVCIAAVAWFAGDGSGAAPAPVATGSDGSRGARTTRAADCDAPLEWSVEPAPRASIARAPTFHFAGTVRDELGNPLASVGVELGVLAADVRPARKTDEAAEPSVDSSEHHGSARGSRETERGMRLLLCQVITGADGRYTADVPLDALSPARDHRMYAEIVQRGYKRCLTKRWIRRPTASVDIDLVAMHGSTLTGTVVDRDGDRVDGARVELLVDDRMGSLVIACDVTRNGEFALDCTYQGSCRLFATTDRSGTAEIHGLSLSGDLPAPLWIVLSEPNWLAGSVVREDGTAPERVELWAFPASKVLDPADELLKWRLSSAASSLSGEHAAFCVSGKGGKFRFDGLAAGSYFVVPADELALDPSLRATWTCRTGSDRIQLVR